MPTLRRSPRRLGKQILNDIAKNLILWAIIAVVLVSVFNGFGPRPNQANRYTYSEFIDQVKNGGVQSVVIDGRTIDF